jgi:alcohol dehydrogenase class IV
MSDIVAVKIPRTVMGLGSISSLTDIVEEFGAKNVSVITGPHLLKTALIDRVQSLLERGSFRFDIFSGCEPDAPTSAIEECSRRVRDGKYDLLIGIGGGSVMDTTKVVSIIAPSHMDVHDLIGFGKVGRRVLPKILIPTTAGTGSEWSDIATISDEVDNRKKNIRNSQIWANVAIVDPEITLNLSSKVTIDPGMDTLTNGIEAYVSCKSNIISDMFAETVIRLVAENLRPAYAKGHKHVEARCSLSIAASLGMAAVTASGVGLAHAMNSAVAGKAHITHGAACSILLPYVMEFNLVAIPTKFAKIAQLMGENISQLSILDAAEKSVSAVKRLSRDVGMPQRLSDVGISDADIPGFIEDLVAFRLQVIEESNPRHVSMEDAVRILRLAL